MHDEDDLLPISALQHLAFCERQCALMYLEGIWAENVLTAQGSRLHEKAHEPERETRRGVRTSRGVRLRSLRLGLSGQADVVEFHRVDGPEADHEPPPPDDLDWLADVFPAEPDAPEEPLTQPASGEGVTLPGLQGRWAIYPVEYKRGRPKPDHCDEVQLCAQALCLEEMLGASIPTGALFYGQPRRRLEVALTADLRDETERLARRLHALIEGTVTPQPRRGGHCKSCSLMDDCLPDIAGRGKSARAFVDRNLSRLLQEADG